MLFHCGESFSDGWVKDDEENDGKVLLPGRPLQQELTKLLNTSALGLRMQWRAGDFAINDNLGLAHYASEGTQGDRAEVGLRILHRTTVLGGEETIPRKADGRRTFYM